MQNQSPTEARKYQLFPRAVQALIGKALDYDKAVPHVTSPSSTQDRSTPDRSSPTSPGAGLRLKLKENGLIRRRKVSVSELGPMTTVHEVVMDSPTIPGRPPLHERSVSAPGHSWRKHALSEVKSILNDATLDRNPAAYSSSSITRFATHPTRQLAPLLIPSNSPTFHVRSGSLTIDPTRNIATKDDSSYVRIPFTPLSTTAAGNPWLDTPQSVATTATTGSGSDLSTPPSSLGTEFHSSPYSLSVRPYSSLFSVESSSTLSQFPTPLTASLTSPTLGLNSQEAEGRPIAAPQNLIHQRALSGPGSVMERGRPKKHTDIRGRTGAFLEQIDSKRSKIAERRAFEELPQGWLRSDAVSKLNQTEVKALKKQAIGQASRFEILSLDDVESLSRELRQLDERMDYLRRTYKSLRAGRRNLHSRICQYLRSPCAAVFNRQSMLRQEEAIAELDASIDDWVSKLERAENRRTRVRQKLLEHLAAAATLPASFEVKDSSLASPAVDPAAAAIASETLQIAMGIRDDPQAKIIIGSSVAFSYIASPTYSPAKPYLLSLSPGRVSSHVPTSAILEQPFYEDGTSGDAGEKTEMGPLAPHRVENIRIYADSDVYALLADVENEISKMAFGYPYPGDELAEDSAEAERIRLLHRERSRELLVGETPFLSVSPLSPTVSVSTPLPRKNATAIPDVDATILPQTVFNSQRPTLTV